MAFRIADSGLLHLSRPPLRVGCKRNLCSPAIYCRKLGDVQQNGRSSHHFLVFKKAHKIIQAAVLPVAPTLPDNYEQRKQMCERYGFTQIGEPVPDNITLKDIMDTLPKKVFEIDDSKAWKSVIVSVTSYVLGILMIAKAPWFLLPLAWAWTGTAVTGVKFLSGLYFD